MFCRSNILHAYEGSKERHPGPFQRNSEARRANNLNFFFQLELHLFSVETCETPKRVPPFRARLCNPGVAGYG